MYSPQSVESLKLKVLSKNLLLILSTQHFLLSTALGSILMRSERGDQTFQVCGTFFRTHQDLTISLDHHEILDAKSSYGSGVRIHDAILRVDRHVGTPRYISVRIGGKRSFQSAPVTDVVPGELYRDKTKPGGFLGDSEIHGNPFHGRKNPQHLLRAFPLAQQSLQFAQALVRLGQMVLKKVQQAPVVP